MLIPDWLLRHEAVIEPFEGEGAYGAIYGDPVTERCLVDDERRLVRNAEGSETVSDTTIFFRAGTHCPEGSRVTVGGRTTTVIASHDRDGGGLPTPDHTEVVCR
jgi:class 3 adenylate cyclase